MLTMFGGITLAAMPSAAAAQVGVSITPTNGTYRSSSLAVTVVLCDLNSGLDLASTTITLNGTSVIGSFSKVSWHCPDGVKSEKYTGTITLAPGANALVATGYDAATGTGTGASYDTLVAVTVTPKGTRVLKQALLPATQTFSVQNTRPSSITFDLYPLCSAGWGCTVSSPVTVPANSSSNVVVSFTAPAANDSDLVKLRAVSRSFAADVDTGNVKIVGEQRLGVSFANVNMDDQQLGLCANDCFAATWTHTSVGYRSLGVDRAVTVRYHDDRTSVRPIIGADVTLPAGIPVPTSLTLSAKVSGVTEMFVNGDTLLHFSTAGLSTGVDHTYRIAGQFNARGVTMGMATLQVTVAASYSDGVNESYTSPSSSKLMVVNLAQYDVLPIHGWTVDGVQRLYKQGDGTVLIVEGDGSGVYFGCAMTTGTACSGPTGDFSTLKQPDSTFVRVYPDSSKAFFNKFGRMTAATDRWGNGLQYVYANDSTGYLTEIVDPKLGSYFWLAYFSGVVRITPPGSNGAAPGTARPTSIAYDGNSRVTAITDADGHNEQFTYDSVGLMATAQDRRGNTTSYTRDPKTWKLSSVTLPAVVIDTAGGNQSPVVHFKPWQTLAVPLTSTVSSAASMARLDTAWGLVVGAVNDTVRFTADRWGQPLVTKDPLGNQTTVQRSGLFATQVTDQLGHVSTFGYTGPFMTSAKPYGQDSTHYQYDSWGMLSYVKAPNSPVISYDYNASPRTIVQYTNFQYPDTTFLDSLGRATRSVDPSGHRAWFYYDALFGNLDSSAVHDTAATNDSSGTRVVLDAFGRDSVVRGYNAPATTHIYDVMGRDSLLYASAGAQPMRFYYDGLLLVRTVDPRGQIFKTSFNALGWPTAIYDAADTTKSRRFYYDVGGRITRARDRRNYDVTMAYDVLGRVTWKEGNSPNDSLQYTYAYSTDGRMVSGVTKDLGGTAIAADTLFALDNGADSVVSWVAGKRFFRRHTATAGTWSDTAYFAYTDASKVNIATVPVNNRLRFWSTSIGQLDSIKLGTQPIAFGYDGELLLSSTTYPSYVLTLTRDEQHLVTQSSYNASAIDSALGRKYVLSPFGTSGRIAGEQWRSGVLSDGSPAYTTRGYFYNGAGAFSQYTRGRTDLTCPTCHSTMVIDTASYAYNYDGVFNPTSDYNNTTGITTYDSVGAANRLDSLGGIWYDYDAEGNRTDKRVAGVYTYYKWNADGQLVGITSGSSSVWYDYSAFGTLLRRTTNGTVDRHYLWDGGQLALEVDGAGTGKIAGYAYSGTDKPLAVWEGTNSAPYFYSHDERGDVTGLTSGTAVLESRHFSPWGVEEFGVTIPENEKFGWKGLPWESGITNLYYVQNRWYDPQSRGFISEDPIGLDGGTNTYAYVDNDPINGADPSGLSGISCSPEYEWVETYYTRSDGTLVTQDTWTQTGVTCETVGAGLDGGEGSSGGIPIAPHQVAPPEDPGDKAVRACRVAIAQATLNAVADLSMLRGIKTGITAARALQASRLGVARELVYAGKMSRAAAVVEGARATARRQIAGTLAGNVAGGVSAHAGAELTTKSLFSPGSMTGRDWLNIMPVLGTLFSIADAYDKCFHPGG